MPLPTDRTPVRWFPALAEPNVRLYLGGQSVSVLGTWVLDITLNLLAWQLSGSPALLGLLNFLLYGPGVIVTPLFSARLTSANARRLTLWVLGGGLAVATGLALLMAAQALTVPLILAFAVARGMLNGMEVPSRQMLLIDSVEDRALIGSAVALNTVVFQLGRMAGPAVAAVVFARAGAAWGFAFSVLALLIMVGCVLRVSSVAATPLDPLPAGVRTGLAGAWAFVRGDRFGGIFLPMVIFQGLFAGGYQTLIPVLADRVYGDANAWTGWFFGAVGCGALLAALLLSTHLLAPALRRLHVLIPWLTVAALAGLGITRTPAIALTCLAGVGFGMAFLATGTNSVLHQRVPPELRGGLIAIFLMAYVGAIPVAQLMAGALAQWASVQTTFLIMAAGMLVCVATMFVPRWRALGRIELNAEKI